jgi:hypothetical protein
VAITNISLRTLKFTQWYNWNKAEMAILSDEVEAIVLFGAATVADFVAHIRVTFNL